MKSYFVSVKPDSLKDLPIIIPFANVQAIHRTKVCFKNDHQDLHICLMDDTERELFRKLYCEWLDSQVNGWLNQEEE